MSAHTTAEQIAEAGGFVVVECCGEVAGYANPKPFTPEAAARFEEIQLRYVSAFDPFGNAWTTDPEVKTLLADPTACGTPGDGQRLPITCRHCGSAFMWAGGTIHRMSKEVS